MKRRPNPDTRLARAIRARDRYRAYCEKRNPMGADIDQWMGWIEWRNARRDFINAEIKSAQAEKRVNQRSKADERSRRP